jgi:hypothetical protein
MVVRTCRMMLFSCFALLAGAALWGVAWLLAVNAGTHGSQLPFTVAFPWSYFLYRIALFGDHTWALKVVTFLQLPLYALVLGAFWETRWRTFVVVTLLGFHALAVGGGAFCRRVSTSRSGDAASCCKPVDSQEAHPSLVCFPPSRVATRRSCCFLAPIWAIVTAMIRAVSVIVAKGATLRHAT